MAKISMADFATLAGVSRAAITQAAKPKNSKTPRLALEADGTINTDLPLNAAYLKKGKREKPADTPAQAKARKSAREMVRQSDTVSPPSSEAGATGGEGGKDDDDDEELLCKTLEVAEEKLKYTRARRINAEADTRLKNLREAREKEITVLRELVQRKFSALDAAIKTNLRDLPRRINAQYHAVSLSEGEAAAERYLESQISAALVRIKDEAQKQGLAE